MILAGAIVALVILTDPVSGVRHKLDWLRSYSSLPEGTTPNFTPACCTASELSSAASRPNENKSLADMHATVETFYGRQFGTIEPVVGTCSPTTPCSVVLFLHGAGERGPIRPWYGPKTYIWRLIDRPVCASCYQSLRSIIVVPALNEDELTWTPHLIRDVAIPLLRHVQQSRMSVLDPSRVYCSGHSVGGYGCMLAAAYGADVFSQVSASSPVNMRSIIQEVNWSALGGQTLQAIRVSVGADDRVMTQAGGLLKDEVATFLAATNLQHAVPVDVLTYPQCGHYTWTEFDNLNFPWLWQGHPPPPTSPFSPSFLSFPVAPAFSYYSVAPQLCSSATLLYGVSGCILFMTLVIAGMLRLASSADPALQRSSSRMDDIEVARAVMALLIVAAHFWDRRHEFPVLQHKEHFVWNFVMISGYVTHRAQGAMLTWESGRKLCSFYWRRLVRVTLSYEVACALSFLVHLPHWTPSAFVELWRQTWWTFVFLQSWVVPWDKAPVSALNLPLWTIPGLLLCWIWYPVLSMSLVGLRAQTYARWFLACSCIAVYSLALLTPREPWGDQFFPPWCLLPFGCGVLVCELLAAIEFPQIPHLCSLRPGLASTGLILLASHLEQIQCLARTWQLPLVVLLFSASEACEQQRRDNRNSDQSEATADTGESDTNCRTAVLWCSAVVEALVSMVAKTGGWSLGVYILQWPLAHLARDVCYAAVQPSSAAMCGFSSRIPFPQFQAVQMLLFLAAVLLISAVHTVWVETELVRLANGLASKLMLDPGLRTPLGGSRG